MQTQLINESKVAQNFSAILNQVMSQSIQFDVIHDQAIVARIVPSPKKVAMAELDQLFARLPRLDEEEIDAFEQDIKTALGQLTEVNDVWE
jgi:antitoxin component of MazEF toxin-antitoxin module